MKNKTKIEKNLTVAIEYLKSIGCREVILFGSLAEGISDKSSDIDLAITGISPRTYFKTVAVMSSIVGQKVDLITMDYISKDFEERIRKQGKNFMQHNKVIDEIEFELKRIEKLFKKYDPLLKKVSDQKPNFIELGSLAMLLHSFYNGLENIFSRIARKIDENMPHGEEWHKELLELMTKQTEKRKHIVLSDSTCEDLKEYLGFRHFSRHAYAFDLDWELMKDLVLRIDAIKKRVIDEIKLFIEKYR